MFSQQRPTNQASDDATDDATAQLVSGHRRGIPRFLGPLDPMTTLGGFRLAQSAERPEPASRKDASRDQVGSWHVQAGLLGAVSKRNHRPGWGGFIRLLGHCLQDEEEYLGAFLFFLVGKDCCG